MSSVNLSISHLNNKNNKHFRFIRILLFLSPLISIIGKNLIVDKLVVLILFVLSFRLGIKERYLVNPYTLFSLVPFTLLIYFNAGSAFMLDLTHSTWLLAIINISVFLLAYMLTPSFHSPKDCISPPGKKGLYIYAFVFYLLSLLSRVIPPLASVLWIFSVPSIVCAMKTKDSRMLLLVLVVMVSSMFGEISKMSVLLHVLTLLICYEKYYVKTLRQRRHMIIFIVVSIACMVFAFSFANKDRGWYDSDEGVEYYSRQGVDWSYNSSFFLPYMYLTTPWANLQYVTETQDYRTNGLWTLKPLLGYIGADEYYSNVFENGLIPYSTFNTFTFIVCGFKDFGFWGSVLVSLLLGFFVKKVYSRYLISKSPLDVASYICVALAVAEMFFSNHFLMHSYPFTCFILMEMSKVVFLVISNSTSADLELK